MLEGRYSNAQLWLTFHIPHLGSSAKVQKVCNVLGRLYKGRLACKVPRSGDDYILVG